MILSDRSLRLSPVSKGETWDVPEKFVGSPEDSVGVAELGTAWAHGHQKRHDDMRSDPTEDSMSSSTWSFRHMDINEHEQHSPADWYATSEP